MKAGRMTRGEVGALADAAFVDGEWDQYWNHTLEETWAGGRWLGLARPRNAPTRGTHPDHDLGTFKNDRRLVLPLAAYDLFERDKHPRELITELHLGDEPSETCLAYPPHLSIADGDALDGYKVQERNLHYGGLIFESILIGRSQFGWEGRKQSAVPVTLASGIDQGKDSRGWSRYHAVATTHRGRGLATLMQVLIYECGAPPFRWSQAFHDFQARENRVQVGMLPALLRAHALVIHRAVFRGVDVPAHVVESAHNWEQIGTDIMMATKKIETAGRGVLAMHGMFAGRDPKSRKERKAAKAERRAKREAAAGNGAASLQTVAAAMLSDDLQDATHRAVEAFDKINDQCKGLEVVGRKIEDATATADATLDQVLKATDAATATLQELDARIATTRELLDELDKATAAAIKAKKKG